jgi:hypothetical protein
LPSEFGTPDAFQWESDGYEAAKARARSLLLEILPPLERDRFANTGVIHVMGSRSGYVYEISPGFQTAIHRQGQVIAYACLQLSMPFPAFDRMVAEYLLIKNDENLYLVKANVFPNDRPRRIARLFLILFDVALVVNLVLAFYRLK